MMFRAFLVIVAITSTFATDGGINCPLTNVNISCAGENNLPDCNCSIKGFARCRCTYDQLSFTKLNIKSNIDYAKHPDACLVSISFLGGPNVEPNLLTFEEHCIGSNIDEDKLIIGDSRENVDMPHCLTKATGILSKKCPVLCMPCEMIFFDDVYCDCPNRLMTLESICH